jgi:vacuolar protein sorting-associated protein 35
VFVFIQETVAMIAKANPEVGHKLYLELALTADSFAGSSPAERSDYASIAYELLSQALSIYEEAITESKAQQRCIKLMIGTLLASRSLSKEDYDGLITKTAVFAAKVVKKPEQCQLVGLCAYLFYPAEGAYAEYGSPQRSLECLQRSLKLADASTSANPSHVGLFVELLEHYLFFFEKKNPLVSHNYISGLVALIKEHLHNLVQSFEGDSRAVVDARGHFQEVIRYIRKKKADEGSAELFGPIQVDAAD